MPTRSRVRALSRAAAAALVLAAAPVPGAAAQSPAARVAEDFTADGAISPCRHDVGELEAAAASGTDATPGLAGAIDAAIAAHRRGDCAPVGAEASPTPAAGSAPAASPTPDPAAAATPVPTPAPTATPAPAVTTAAADGDVPLAAWILGAAALLLALLTTFVALVSRRRTGGEPLAGVGHAWRELGHRAGGAWLDFADWMRYGR